MTDQSSTPLAHTFRGWDIWRVSTVVPNGTAWSAKPAGTKVAVPGCANLPNKAALAIAVADYERHLARNIAQTERDLSGSDPMWVGRIAMLTERLAALKTLQALLVSEATASKAE